MECFKMGALNKSTNQYEYPKFAQKSNKYICPDCKKELQSRHMFNHIRKLHPDYFSSMMKVYKEDDLENLIKHNKGMPLEWEYKNDKDVIKSVNSVKVDGKKIKPNIYYKLVNGKIIKA